MRLAGCLAESLYRDQRISENEREVVLFGLESLEGSLLSFGMTLAVGICFGKWVESIFLWIFLWPIRKNAGGFHAKTEGKCLLTSAVMLIGIFMIFSRYTFSYTACGAMAVIWGIFIWILSPVDSAAKRLDEKEREIYGRRSRLLLVIETMILIASIYGDAERIVHSISMAYCMAGISLLLGYRYNLGRKKIR